MRDGARENHMLEWPYGVPESSDLARPASEAANRDATMCRAADSIDCLMSKFNALLIPAWRAPEMDHMINAGTASGFAVAVR